MPGMSVVDGDLAVHALTHAARDEIASGKMNARVTRFEGHE